MISFNDKTEVRVGPPTGIGVKAGSNSIITFLDYVQGVNQQTSNGGTIFSCGATPSNLAALTWVFTLIAGDPLPGAMPVGAGGVFSFTSTVGSLGRISASICNPGPARNMEIDMTALNGGPDNTVGTFNLAFPPGVRDVPNAPVFPITTTNPFVLPATSITTFVIEMASVSGSVTFLLRFV